MIDATRITSHLWIGSAPLGNTDLRAKGFRALVLAAEEIQPSASYFPGVLVIHAPLDDRKPTPREIRIARLAASDVVDIVQSGGQVLVTCAQGRNRSALIVGLAMKKLMPGLRPSDVIAYIQSMRDDSLTNPWFVELIMNDEKERARA